MTMDQAAVFLAGSVLTVLCILVIVGGVVIVNNIIHKYWKKLDWDILPASWHQLPPRFVDAHAVDKSIDPKFK